MLDIINILYFILDLKYDILHTYDICLVNLYYFNFNITWKPLKYDDFFLLSNLLGCHVSRYSAK